MKTFSMLLAAAAAGIAVTAVANERFIGAELTAASLATQDVPTFYLETTSRSADLAASLDTLSFYTPTVARASDAQINETFYLAMVARNAISGDAKPSLDLLVFYTPMVVRPVVAFDAQTEALSFYTPMVRRASIESDVRASVETLAFYVPMVVRSNAVEFDVQTTFDVPVPYERRAARFTAKST